MSAVIVGPSSSPKASIAQADALEIEAQAKRRLANGNGARPPPCAFLRGRAGRRLEIDDPTLNRDSSRSLLRHFEDPRIGTHAPGEAFSAKAPLMMKYRNIEYTVVQSIERGLWKWSASVTGVLINGQAAIKSEAVTPAEKAIDRALAAKKVRRDPSAF